MNLLRIMKAIYRRLRLVWRNWIERIAGTPDVADYWTRHNVTQHQSFASREESLDYLEWRNSRYLNYVELMPLKGHDGKVMLDYGCGPGHDLVGFVEYSKPKKVYGLEVSSSSLAEAEKRLELHGATGLVETRLIPEGNNPLPFPDATFDYIHSSGVLHHVTDLNAVMKELGRVLKPDGVMRIMVYNYESLFLHLHVAYNLQITQKIDSGRPLLDAFRRSTDGWQCPISHCYKHREFEGLVNSCGFKGGFIGAAISLLEMSLLPIRFQAIDDRRLSVEHRDFLRSLTFDAHGYPLIDGAVAGIDAVYEFRKQGG